ncbi:MAG TPA: hypothetical protein PKW03_09860 [Acetivibrio sp.]|nr:hypothetical protein [Acetivibrio sp.]
MIVQHVDEEKEVTGNLYSGEISKYSAETFRLSRSLRPYKTYRQL